MSTLCVSLAERTADAFIAALAGVDCAEIRLDALEPPGDGIERIFAGPRTLVATCRPGGIGEDTRQARLIAAIDAGASYVDVELGAEAAWAAAIRDRARSRGCKVIVSFHDFAGTPGRAELEAILDRCFAAGADLAKIACLARTPADAARLLGLLADGRPLVVAGMGPAGAVTRVAAPLLGSPLTFCSPAEGRETAPGQIPHAALEAILRAIENA